MSEVYEKLMKCYKSVREKTDFVPEAALILGSGLGDYADDLKIEASVNYADIEGFPVSTVKGHKGRFVFAHVEGVPMVIMQGRVHYYEGYPMSDVVLPTRLMGLLGAKKNHSDQRSRRCELQLQTGRFYAHHRSYHNCDPESPDRRKY